MKTRILSGLFILASSIILLGQPTLLRQSYTTNDDAIVDARVNAAIQAALQTNVVIVSGVVTLKNGTNIVLAPWFNSNAPPTLTYISSDGTLSDLTLRPTEYLQGSYFTIRSGNPADTNDAGYTFATTNVGSVYGGATGTNYVGSFNGVLAGNLNGNHYTITNVPSLYWDNGTVHSSLEFQGFNGYTILTGNLADELLVGTNYLLLGPSLLSTPGTLQAGQYIDTSGNVMQTAPQVQVLIKTALQTNIPSSSTQIGAGTDVSSSAWTYQNTGTRPLLISGGVNVGPSSTVSVQQTDQVNPIFIQNTDSVSTKYEPINSQFLLPGNTITISLSSGTYAALQYIYAQ